MTVKTIVDICDGLIPEGTVLYDCVPYKGHIKIGVEGFWSSMNGTFKMRVFDGEYEIIEEENGSSNNNQTEI